MRLHAVGIALTVGVALGGCSTPATAPGSDASSVAVMPPAPAKPSARAKAPEPSETPATPPPITDQLIPYGPDRLAQMRQYALAHYGKDTTTLDPTLIVLHFTESPTADGIFEHFADNQPQLGESPGVCSHFLIDTDGQITRMVPENTMCRHVIGLNDTAIGIEFVQASAGNSPTWSAEQILGRAAQREAGLALVRYLQTRFSIATDAVIGHAMANDSPRFHDLKGWRNDHGDWGSAEVNRFRALL